MDEHDPRLSEAYRAASHPEPPPRLDARILAAARAALIQPARRRSRWFAWAAPVATSAVLVLGLSLLFSVQREAPETLREATPPPAQADAERMRPQAAPADLAAASAPPARARTAERSPAATPDLALPMPAPHAGEAASRASAAPTAAAPEPPGLPAEALGAAQPAPAVAKAAAESAERAPTPAAVPARQAAPAVGAGMARLKAAGPAAEPPESWLESIRQMIREGRLEEARKSLQELRKRYPDFPLTDDLKALEHSGRAP